MRNNMIEKKKLVCDVCGREDGAKSEWEGTIDVREWGNPWRQPKRNEAHMEKEQMKFPSLLSRA